MLIDIWACERKKNLMRKVDEWPRKPISKMNRDNENKEYSNQPRKKRTEQTAISIYFILWFEYEMIPTGLYVWIRGSQLLVLFWVIVKPLVGKA